MKSPQESVGLLRAAVQQMMSDVATRQHVERFDTKEDLLRFVEHEVLERFPTLDAGSLTHAGYVVAYLVAYQSSALKRLVTELNRQGIV